jgi:hypothetical protein
LIRGFFKQINRTRATASSLSPETSDVTDMSETIFDEKNKEIPLTVVHWLVVLVLLVWRMNEQIHHYNNKQQQQQQQQQKIDKPL